VRILLDKFSRFTFRSSLYDSQLVYLEFPKVTCFIDKLPIWKNMNLWSNKDGSLDTCQLLTTFTILLVPSVRSKTSLLLQTTTVGSLPWLRLFRFELTRNSMRFLLLDCCRCSPKMYGVHWHLIQWLVAFTCYGSSHWYTSLPWWWWFISIIWKVGRSNNKLLTASAIYMYVILTVVVSLEQNSSKGKALIWFLI
jgi:hypothetical protein